MTFSITAVTPIETGPIQQTAMQTSNAMAFADVLERFKQAASETPAERARAHVLEKHKLSEEEYRALPIDQRKLIDAEIAQAVQLAIGATQVGERGDATVAPDNGFPIDVLEVVEQLSATR